MTEGRKTMNVTLEVAIFGAVVTAIGWLITHILTTSAESRRQRLISQMEFTKQQLEELYGPLTFLILEGDQTFQDFNAALGWKEDPPEGYVLSEQERQTVFFWVENDFFPRNKKIQELLSSKTHLIEGEVVPESFLIFLDHYNSWYINHLRLQKQGIEYGWRSKIAWPINFNKDVTDTFKYLKKRHADLIGMIAEAPSFRYQVWRKFGRKIPQKQIDQEASKLT
jgi:hypothetical protein